MNRFATAITLGVLVAGAAAATAQPARQAPPPPPQPMPVESSERPRGTLSQINGTPIPVGDHNQYYYEVPKTNLALNPLGWIFGIYGASASVAVHDHVAIRGDFTYYDVIDTDTTGMELNISAPIYFRRVYSGVFLEPGFMIRRFRDDGGSGEDTTMGPQALVGWHWMWDSGLNFSMAIGGGRDIGASKDEFDGGEEAFFNGYMRFGYAF
jgi:hypothetical protein